MRVDRFGNPAMTGTCEAMLPTYIRKVREGQAIDSVMQEVRQYASKGMLAPWDVEIIRKMLEEV